MPADRGITAPGYAPAAASPSPPVTDEDDLRLTLLDDLVAAHTGFPQVTDDPTWRIEVDGFDPLREREIESWLTVANGRVGTRGALEEPRPEAAPGVYVAGVYGRTQGRLPGPDMLRGPVWTRLHPRVDGETVDLDRGETVEHRRVLDLRQGILFREWEQRLPSGRAWRFRSARFASLAEPGILALQAEGSSEGATVSLAGEVPLAEEQDGVDATTAPADAGTEVTVLRATEGGSARFAISTHEEDGRLQRLVAVRRVPGDAGEDDVEEALARAESGGIARLRARHRREWQARWRDADVTVEGHPELQRMVRFAVAHLIGSGEPQGDLASIGARGLTGPGYRGHVFWDTDVFILPFFIWTHPPTARALLAYRHRTLPAARAKAADMGYDGALYAWESADTGDETAPLFAWRADGTRVEILTGLMEHHISAGVAWASWQYWRATGDEPFLAEAGAEMILETARFWASRAERGQSGRFHIDRVIGPDEYHEGIRDNAYTNVLARWNLRTAAELVDLLPTLDRPAWSRLQGQLGLRSAEVRRWGEVAERLVDGFDPESLLYEQFAGFFRLEDIRAVDVAPRPFTADTILGAPRVRGAQVVKQADVLMLPIMLPDVPTAVAEANYRYYEPRTSHGSSLSPAAHAAVAARIGALDDAERYFRLAAAIDLDDQMGNAAQGLHLANMGCLWQAAVIGFGGVRPGDSALHLDPRLPPGWEGLTFAVRWRGARVGVEIRPDTLAVELDRPAPVALGTEAPVELGAGRFVARRLDRKWSALQAEA